MTGTNTYSGGTTVSAGTLFANSTNSLGLGDVTVSGGQLVINTENAMTNTAALYLPATSNLTLNANLAVARLFVGGVAQPNGTYDNSETWIGGAGQLKVGPDILFWDTDDTAPGAGGGTAPSGIWNTGNLWNNVDGDGSAGPWVAGRTAVFSAGTTATGDYTVTVDATKDIGGLTVEEGNVTLSGGTALRLTADTSAYVANVSQTATVASVISEDGSARSLTKLGNGTLVLSGANSFTGPTTLNAGKLVLSNDDAIAPEVVSLEGGDLQVDANVSISNLVFSTTNMAVSGSGNLNFLAGAVINSDWSFPSSSGAGGAVHAISCGISGSPDVRLRQSPWRGYETKCKQNRFEPGGTNTQALGVIRFDYYNDSGAGALVVLGGSSTNNTLQTFYAPNHSYDDRVRKEGSGTWRITGNSDGQYYGLDIDVVGGTLIWNGALTNGGGGKYTITNGTFAGNHYWSTKYDTLGNIYVQRDGILSPGDGGVGTMTFDWVPTSRANAEFHMQDGSIYAYDVGTTTNDIIHISGTSSSDIYTETLHLDNFILRVLDAGGNPKGEPLPVFTYDSYVSVDTNDFPNIAANFDLATAGIESWGSGGLSLSNNVSEGVIYLVGLAKPPSGTVILFK